MIFVTINITDMPNEINFVMIQSNLVAIETCENDIERMISGM